MYNHSVSGNHPSGPKKHTREHFTVEQIIKGGGVVAAHYVVGLVNGTVKVNGTTKTRLKAALRVLDYVVGEPVKRIALQNNNGDTVISYTQLIMMAEGQAGNSHLIDQTGQVDIIQKGDKVIDSKGLKWVVTDCTNPAAVRLVWPGNRAIVSTVNISELQRIDTVLFGDGLEGCAGLDGHDADGGGAVAGHDNGGTDPDGGSSATGDQGGMDGNDQTGPDDQGKM